MHAFSGAVLLRATFDRSNLQGADLSRVAISESSMSNVDLTNATLYKAEVDETVLTHACLRHVQLDRMDATEVDLTGTELSRSTARGFDCRRSDLRGARLRDLRLDCTAFVDCRVAGADLFGWSGTLERCSRIDAGDRSGSLMLEGDTLLAWLAEQGGAVTWSDPL